MFYALKLSDYMGWRYETYASEKEAIEHFFSHQNHKILVSDRVQLFRMDILHTGGFEIYPVFVPTHKFTFNRETFKYEWKKVKKTYQLKGK